MKKTMNYPQYVGSKFNLLTIEGIERVKEGPRWVSFFKVLCDCGVRKTVPAYKVVKGERGSCGCQQGVKIAVDHLDQVKTFAHTILRVQAKSRKIDCDLDLIDFVALSEANCNYCGCAPEKDMAVQWRKKVAAERLRNGGTGDTRQGVKDVVWFTNGLDRVDSQGDYTRKNLVACCRRCNQMKNDLTHEQFVQHLKNVAKHMFGAIIP